MTCSDCLSTLRPARATRLPFWRRIGRILALRRQRTRLAQLDDRILRDIGVTPYQAWVEANRPSWDPPAHWRN
ncbi:MAG: DUF1127 domain-containing protein [Paracoccaceae bacterium]